MGTTRSSETLTEAEYFRSIRRTSQADVDAKAKQHRAQLRFAPHDRHVPAAH